MPLLESNNVLYQILNAQTNACLQNLDYVDVGASLTIAPCLSQTDYTFPYTQRFSILVSEVDTLATSANWGYKILTPNMHCIQFDSLAQNSLAHPQLCGDALQVMVFAGETLIGKLCDPGHPIQPFVAYQLS